MKTKGPWAISLTLETVSKSNQDLQKQFMLVTSSTFFMKH